MQRIFGSAAFFMCARRARERRQGFALAESAVNRQQ